MIAKIGQVAYKLRLLADFKIYPVFHISLLKPYFGPSNDVHSSLLNAITSSSLTPEAILEHSFSSTSSTIPVTVKIKWFKLHVADSTWLPCEEFTCLFPNFRLRDKAVSEAVGNDTCSFLAHSCEEKEKSRHANLQNNWPNRVIKALARYSN